MVALADQGTMSAGQTKLHRAASLGWRSGLDGIRLDDHNFLFT